MTDAPEKFPPNEWFAAVAEGGPQFVAFRDVDGGTELVEAEWVEENVFDILDHPLRVDGVSMLDRVEVAWDEGSTTPRYARTRRRSGGRTVRALAPEDAVRRFLWGVEEYGAEGLNILVWGYRYEGGVLAFCLLKPALEELRAARLLARLIPGEWKFTDTGTQE